MPFPRSNYPSLSALRADMVLIARDAMAARGTVTRSDFVRAGLTLHGPVLDASAGVRRAFTEAEIDEQAPRIMARVREQARTPPAAPQDAIRPASGGLTRPEIARRFMAPLQAHHTAAEAMGKERDIAVALVGFFLGCALIALAALEIGA